MKDTFEKLPIESDDELTREAARTLSSVSLEPELSPSRPMPSPIVERDPSAQFPDEEVEEIIVDRNFIEPGMPEPLASTKPEIGRIEDWAIQEWAFNFEVRVKMLVNDRTRIMNPLPPPFAMGRRQQFYQTYLMDMPDLPIHDSRLQLLEEVDVWN